MAKTAYLAVLIDSEIFMISLDEIYIVIPIAELDHSPQESKHCEGILNFHGTLIPVFHLASLLNKSIPEYTIHSPIVIAKLENDLLGLLVNDVLDVTAVKQTTLQKPGHYQKPPYVVGLLESPERSATLISLNALFNYHQIDLRRSYDTDRNA